MVKTANRRESRRGLLPGQGGEGDGAQDEGQQGQGDEAERHLPVHAKAREKDGPRIRGCRRFELQLEVGDPPKAALHLDRLRPQRDMRHSVGPSDIDLGVLPGDTRGQSESNPARPPIEPVQMNQRRSWPR